MKITSFEFNIREVAGPMGDFGTLFPLAIGYIAVCGLDPAGLLIMMGLANIITGLIDRLPIPIEPMKVLAVMQLHSTGHHLWFMHRRYLRVLYG
jgi:SulP family sulfate permease